MALLIREAREDDVAAVLMLYGQPGIDNGEMLSLEEGIRAYRRLAGYPDYRLFVAEAEGAILGTFTLLVVDSLAHLGAPSAIVDNVAVAPDRQRRGIGRRMMLRALAECRLRHCRRVSLHAHINPARTRAFYEALGFARQEDTFVVDLAAEEEPMGNSRLPASALAMAPG